MIIPNIISVFRKETEIFSKWFKAALVIGAAIYLMAWLFTIYLSSVQESRGITPILPVFSKDSGSYAELSQSIINDHSFVLNGKIETMLTPGYSFFVAVLKVVTGSYFGVTLIQIFLVFGSAIILRRIGQLFMSKQAGEIAAVFLIANPATLAISLAILSDILFLFLFISGFYLALSSVKEGMVFRVMIVSLLFGIAIYVRPMGVLAFPIFIVPFLASGLFLKEKIKSIGLMVILIVVVLSPWIIRNYALTGVADFSSFKASNMSEFAIPMFLSYLNGTTVTQERDSFALTTGIPMSSWHDLRFSDALNKASEKILLEHPFEYIWYQTSSSLPFLFSSTIEYASVFYRGAMHIQPKYVPGSMNFLLDGDWRSFFDSIFSVWWKVGERALWLILYFFVVAGIWINRKKYSTWAFVFVILYLMFLAGPVGNARYALPTLPFTFVLAAAGMINLLKNKHLGAFNSFFSGFAGR